MIKKVKTTIISSIALVMAMFLSASCKGNSESMEILNVDTLCNSPYTVICLQPLDDFSQKETEKLRKDLLKHTAELGLGEVVGVEVLPNKPLTPSLMNDDSTRYRADKVIRYVQKDKDNRRIIIAITHKDISVPLRGKKDWGVMGLSLQPGTACVVSTYRIKDKSQLWKVAIHEFFHTYYNMPHCPNDDKTCIMKDAEGRGNLATKRHLCKDCQKRAIL